MIREIVHIDEERCDGCGQCVPACHEGAIQIVDGKARLLADQICDGLGACLGHCPQGAIRIERREAQAFDEVAVARHLAAGKAAGGKNGAARELPTVPWQQQSAGGCPGSRVRRFEPPREESPDATSRPSQLGHWPVKLRLLPPQAPFLRGAHLLVAADCAPFAFADFHPELLRGKVVAIGCPKFDPLESYVEKLAEMLRLNDLVEVTVVHMEVPCCTGIAQAVYEARRRAGTQTPITDVVIGTQGQILSRRSAT